MEGPRTRWRPPTAYGIYVGADGWDSVAVPSDQDVYGTCPGCDLFGYRDTTGDWYKTANNRQPFINLDTYGASLTVDWSSGEFGLRSITAYEDVEKLSGEDTDVSPVPFIEVTNPVDSGQWTQEFQLSHTAHRSRFTAGFFLLS